MGCGCGSGANDNAFKSAFTYYATKHFRNIDMEKKLKSALLNQEPIHLKFQFYHLKKVFMVELLISVL